MNWRLVLAAFVALDVALVAFIACQPPLKVSHPERWEPGYGATDYPAARKPYDAGADAVP